jgi:glycosyltransferase involved in cell wall biosynthesis
VNNAQISAIVPTYNSSAYIVETVESIVSQTVQVDEVIVVDDGSTDDTSDKLKPYMDRIRYIHKENGGVSTARNLGVAEARGDWIAFLDSDDVWHPNKIETQLAALRSNPDVKLLGTELYNWPGQHPILADVALDVPNVTLSELLIRNSLVTSTIMVETATIRKAGEFDPTLFGPEDHDIWIRICRIAPTAKLNVGLTGYRTVQGSLSKNPNRMTDGMKRILEKCEADGLFDGKPLLRRKAWGYFHYSAAFMYKQAGMKRLSRDHIFKSLALFPGFFDRSHIRHPLGRLRLLAKVII